MVAGDEAINVAGTEPLIFGKYKLLEPLGQGGMAEVYKALSVGAAGFQRPVVIKRILPSLSSNRQFVEMFIKEASIAASLDHPNIVQVFDLGEDEGDLFMVLEYVPGLDLGTVAQHYKDKGKRLPHQLVAYVAVDMCKALECAHGFHDASGKPAPVIHRDVSPQNVLLSMNGGVKLADFGLAMALTDNRITMPGIIKGKLGYLSPEQAAGALQLDTRSDLFSLGVVLHEAIAGRRLFVGRSPAETMKRIQEAKVPGLGNFVKDIPEALEEIIRSLLSRNPDERPNSAIEVRRSLAQYLRRVHPPVDATTLAGVVRHTFHERAEGEGISGQGDDVVTQEYVHANGQKLASGEPDLSIYEPAVSNVPTEVIEQPLSEADTLSRDDKEKTDPTTVIIAKVVSVGSAEDDDPSGAQ